MSDLTERLRALDVADFYEFADHEVAKEAADEIERLTDANRVLQKDVNDFLDIRRKDAKRNAELEAALDKLARLGNEPDYGNSRGNEIAREALAAQEKDDDCRSQNMVS
jgi:hypothetical protein